MNHAAMAGSALALTLLISSNSFGIGWPKDTDANSSRAGNIQASPLVANLGGDAFAEIAIPSFDDYLYVWQHDGTTTGTWPRQMGFGDGTIASLAAGDLDGDSVLEIVAFGDNSQGKNPELKAYQLLSSTTYEYSFPTSSSRRTAKSTPAVINCRQFDGSDDHDGEEIIVRDGTGDVTIFSLNGSSLDPIATLDTIPSGEESTSDRYNLHLINPSVSVRDLIGGNTLLVAPSTNGRVYVWTLSSSASNNLDVGSATVYNSNDPTETAFFGSGTLADLDQDSEVDLIIGGSDGRVYVWEIVGDSLGARSGWPQLAKAPGDIEADSISSTPAVGQLNLNVSPMRQIAVGSNDGFVYVWNADGTEAFTGGRLSTNGDVSSSPLIADVDGTGSLELVATSLDGRVYVWDSAGSLLSGWPKRLGSPTFASPALADLRNSGHYTLITADYNGTVFCFDLPSYYRQSFTATKNFRGSFKRQGFVD